MDDNAIKAGHSLSEICRLFQANAAANGTSGEQPTSLSDVFTATSRYGYGAVPESHKLQYTRFQSVIASASEGKEGTSIERPHEAVAIDAVDGEGRTALHWAVSYRQWELAATLLSAPYYAVCNTVDAGGVTPLMTAISVASSTLPPCGSVTAVSLGAYDRRFGGTIQVPVVLNLMLSLSQTPPPAETAADKTLQMLVIRELLHRSHFTTANQVPLLGESALAASDSTSGITHPSILQPPMDQSSMCCIYSSNTPGAAADSSLKDYSSSGQLDSYLEWVNKQDHDSGNSALSLAASRGNGSLLRLLLNHAVVSSVGGNTRLCCDLFCINKRGQTVLHRLVSRNNVSAVEEVISFCRKHHMKMTKRFVNCPDTNGDTALHYASMESNREMGEMLLKNGADRDTKNKQGRQFWQL